MARREEEAAAAAAKAERGAALSDSSSDSENEAEDDLPRATSDPDALAAFIVVAAFSGYTAGYVFKMDTLGLGYYLDDPVRAKLTQAAQRKVRDEEDDAVRAAFGGGYSSDEDVGTTRGQLGRPKNSFFMGNALSSSGGLASAKRKGKMSGASVIVKRAKEDPVPSATAAVDVGSLLGGYGSDSSSD